MSAIVLSERTIAPYVVKHGATDAILPAGKRLTIESSPQGEEFLNQVVPVGKQWDVQVSVVITETDA
jgi:hypothetical protein